MKQTILSVSLLALAATVAPAQLSAQNLNALSGTYVFSVQGAPMLEVQRYMRGDATKAESKAGYSYDQTNSFVIVGQFKASIGLDRAGNQIGVLAINATSIINGSTTRLEGDVGRYQINSTGTGGTITMNLSSYPMQYDFWFSKGGTVINLVSTLQEKPATGYAVRAPEGCPAGVGDLLSLVSGAYAFKLQHIPITSESFSDGYGIAGRFTASIVNNRAGQPTGSLAIVATSNFTRRYSVTRQERDAGSYQINSDCSGGTLTFNLSSRPYQYQFYFNADFTELHVISTSNVPIYGIVTKTSVGGVCPANPLSLLSGPWTFNVQTLSQLYDPAQISVAGRFVASAGTNTLGQAVGLLKINASTLRTARNGGNDPTRLETDAGSFQINADCTGGTLTMNLSSYPMQYDFWFYDNYQKMYIVSTTAGRGATGSATVGVSGCPVNGPVNPVNLMVGTYGFRAQRVPNFTYEPFGIAGVFTVAPQPGLLQIRATSSVGPFGGVARLEGDVGQYQIDADCTGGILQFNLSSRPTQYQFYFRAGFTEADMISLVGPAAYGVFAQ